MDYSTLLSVQNFSINLLSGIISAVALGILLPRNRFFRYGFPLYVGCLSIYMLTQFFILPFPAPFFNTFWYLVYYSFAFTCFSASKSEIAACIFTHAYLGFVFLFLIVFPLQTAGIMTSTFIVTRPEHLWIFFVASVALFFLLLAEIQFLKHFPIWRRLPMPLSAGMLFFHLLASTFFEASSSKFSHAEKTILLFIMITFLLFGAFVAFFYTQKIAARKRNQLLLQQQEMQIHYYKLLSKEYIDLRKFRTDVYQQVQNLKQILSSTDSSRSNQLIQQIQQHVFSTKPTFSSGNIAIDALIQSKLPEIQQKDCRLEICIDIPSECGIRDIDLICIFANLLDNALHAAHTGDVLSISGHLNSGVCVITVKNPAHGNDRIPKDFSARKLSLDGHGIGLASVKNTVQQYDGQFSVCNENGTIVARALMLQQFF